MPVTAIEAHFESCFEQMSSGTSTNPAQRKQQPQHNGASRAVAPSAATAAAGSSSGGKRGVSINHLIKFTRASQDTGNGMYSPPQRTSTSAAMMASRQRRRLITRETFVQANCQFRVRWGGDYSVALSNADLMLDWDLIEEVSIPLTETPR